MNQRENIETMMDKAGSSDSSAPGSPRIWVVVLTYNGTEDTRKCLRSLAKVSDSALATVVVDNASDDHPIPALEQDFPWCHFIRNPDNLGFAGGNNRGIEYCLAHGADWVVLLNNDTTVSADFGDRLAAAARAHPSFGVIGPVINFMDEPDAVMTDGILFNPPGFQGFFLRKPIALTNANPPTIADVDVVNGCCMMIAADVVRRIGLIDERFFIYHEETDFCLRALQAGFRCGVIGNQLVWHKGTSSFKRLGRPLPRYYDARNLILLLRKHRGAKYRGRTALASALMYLRYMYWRYCDEREHGEHGAAQAIVEGLCDGVAGRYGRYAPVRRMIAGPLILLFEAARHRPRLQFRKAA